MNQIECPECGGSWVTEAPEMGSYTHDLGESIGDKVVWANVQRRYCETCQLTEERLQFRPGDDWSRWELT